jgi:protein-S-isoprenylcysteine O-methyltransferase Ste14
MRVARSRSGAAGRRGGAPAVPLLADRWLPALLFAAAAGARGPGILDLLVRPPAGADLSSWLLYLLEVTGGVLAVLFCGLVATLFLGRRAPRGDRAGLPAIAVALAGTFLMSGAVAQPATSRDWRLLALADGLLAGGLAFSIYAAAGLGTCFGLAAEARGLVTTGAYRLVRHPLYLGELVAGLGLLLPVLAPPTVLVYAAFCACQAARAALEERALEATFPEYADYRRRTPALLPWPRPRPARGARRDVTERQ